jgi:hypothetical protein
MNAQDLIAPTSGRLVPGQARQLAGRLSALFEKDSLIAGRLNDAQRRLRNANERLWSGLAPDAFGRIYDGTAPAGHSQIAELIDPPAGDGPASQMALLGALQDAHWTIHRAFHDYQTLAEQRRQLAADVGELCREFIEALTQAGWTEHEARDADVHQLAAQQREKAR